MRKLFACILLCALALGILGCGGNEENLTVIDIDSEIYSQEDYLAAVQAVTEISYAGDETVQKEQEYILSFGDYDEGIVLLSSFTVDEHGGDGSLEPNGTYTRWGWYLARKNGGKWKLVTSGYG